MPRHRRAPLILTGNQMLEVGGQLSAAGIVGDDMVRSVKVLLAHAPADDYDQWRAHLADLSGANVEASHAAMAKVCGNDAVRAAHVLSRRS